MRTGNFDTTSPATDLVKLGYAAVPALIAALDDQRFSRSVGYWRNFTFSHHVLTVGDCAEQILERISGQRLFDRRTTSSYMSKDDETAAAKKEAEAWWRPIQQKGEWNSLVENLGRGGQDATRAAAMLRDRYPDKALPLLVEAAKQAESWDRIKMVEIVGGVPGDAPLPFLTEEMYGGADPVRAPPRAAEALCTKGKVDEAVAAMIADWEKTKALPARNAPVRPGDWIGDSFGGIGYFLTGIGRVSATRAVSDGLRQWPDYMRLTIVEELDPTWPHREAWEAAGIKADEAKAYEAAVEMLLIEELEDTERRFGDYSSMRHGTPYVDPRICDIAGDVLALRYPDKYRFDFLAPSRERDRQRIAFINLWRAEHGKTPLPPVQESTLTPALEALQAFAAALPPGEPARAQVEGSVKEMSCTVITTGTEGLPLEDPAERGRVQEWLDAFKGKPLTSAAVAAWMAKAVDALPKGTDAVTLIAAREDNLGGVSVRIRLHPIAPHRHDVAKDRLGIDETLTVGNRYVSGNARPYPPNSEKGDNGSGFLKQIDEALRGPAEQPFSVRVYIDK